MCMYIMLLTYDLQRNAIFREIQISIYYRRNGVYYDFTDKTALRSFKFNGVM